MNNLFFLTIVSVITYITSKECTVAWVEANPAFTNPRQCFNATDLIVVKDTQRLTKKVEVSPCADKEHNCALPYGRGGVDLTADQPAFCEHYAVKESRYAGESCNHDLECYSQECQSGICKGRAYNQTCDHDKKPEHAYCDVGLACRQKAYPEDGEHKPVYVCVPQISNNHTFCTEDEHCSNDKGCNTQVYGPDAGICVDYYSLSNFEKSSKKELCKSNYIDSENRCIDILFIAEDKKTTSAFECLADTQQCLYQISGRNPYDSKKPNENVIRLDCECSKSADPKAYCPLDTLGAKGQAVKEEAKKRIVTGVHTKRRFDDSKLTKDYYFPQFEQATDNVYKTHVKYDAHTSSSSFLKFSLLAIILIFAL